MEAEPTEIKALKRIVWRTAIAVRVERFSALLSDPEAQKYFGEAFVEKISARVERIYRFIMLLMVIYALLMLALFNAQDPNKSEFQVFGFSFKNLRDNKEFILLIASLISPISCYASAYHRYLVALRKAALGKLFPNPQVQEFIVHVYADEYAQALLKDRSAAHIQPHGLSMLVAAGFALALIALFVALVVASFVLQLVVLQDVIEKPASSPIVNSVVVWISIGSIVLSWIICFMQLPLPDVDLGAYQKLEVLRRNDEQAYLSTVRRLSADSARKERTWATAMAASVFVAIFCLIAWSMNVSPYGRLSGLLSAAIPGLALSVLFATAIASRAKSAMYRWYFRRFPEGTDAKAKAFTRVTWAVGLVRVGLTVAIALAYSTFAVGRL